MYILNRWALRNRIGQRLGLRYRGIEFIDENGGGQVCAFAEVAQAEAVRTCGDDFAKRTQSFHAVIEAPLRMPR